LRLSRHGRWRLSGTNRRHVYLIRLDLHARPNLRQRADNDRVMGIHALDHAQAILLQRARRNAAILHLVLLVHHIDELQSLIRTDGPISDQQSIVSLANRQVDTHEHPRHQHPFAIRKFAADFGGARHRINLRLNEIHPAVEFLAGVSIERDDRWIAISVETDAEWQALCSAMARPDLATDPRLMDLTGRLAAEGELDMLISAWTADEEPFALPEGLQAAGVPAENVVVERISGAAKVRPLFQALISKLDDGDTLAVWKVDRLGRSTVEALQTAQPLDEGVHQPAVLPPGLTLRPVRLEARMEKTESASGLLPRNGRFRFLKRRRFWLLAGAAAPPVP